MDIRSFVLAGYVTLAAWCFLLAGFLLLYRRQYAKAFLGYWAVAMGLVGVRASCSGIAIVLATSEHPNEDWRTLFSSVAQVAGHLLPLFLVLGSLSIRGRREPASPVLVALGALLVGSAGLATWLTLESAIELRLLLRLGLPSLAVGLVFVHASWVVAQTEAWSSSFGRVWLSLALALYGAGQLTVFGVRVYAFASPPGTWIYFLGYADILWTVLIGLGVLLWQLEEERDRTQAALEMLRKSEEQLLHTQKMQAVGQLAGGIAHDFNNVLTAIVGHASLVLPRVEDDPESKELVEQVLSAGGRAGSLVRRLMSFSRQGQLDPRPIDLNRAAEATVEMVRCLFPPEVRLEQDLARRLPLVEMDRGQAEMILVNLMLNARDAMPEGGELRVETRARTGLVELAVCDEGTGMSAEVQERVFEPFFTTKEGGTGIGLASVYSAVERAGGSVRVESELGRGTRIVVQLPRSSANAEDSDTHFGVDIGSGQGRTVLLVDDDAQVLEFASRALRLHGCEVLEAEDGLQALEVARAHAGEIGLLLTDVRMPHMGGPELAEALQRTHSALRVLYMTGFAGEHEYAVKGCGDVLMKPFSMEELCLRVDAAQATDELPPSL